MHANAHVARVDSAWRFTVLGKEAESNVAFVITSHEISTVAHAARRIAHNLEILIYSSLLCTQHGCRLSSARCGLGIGLIQSAGEHFWRVDQGLNRYS